MNRTDRLFAIVLELQARKHARAEDLAALFEVTKRTIYRDMLALAESGIPVISMPGQGYSLVEGYFLPPLAFTANEATMLLLGTDFVAQNFDAQYRDAAQAANHKIKSVLPDNQRHEVETLETSIQFMALNGPFAPETLQQVRRAIIEHRTLRFRYHARHYDGTSAGDSVREADPYTLLYINGAWVLTAYCHLRTDQRHFRLDRIEEVAVLDKKFTRPANFKAQYDRNENRTVTVRALLDHEVARWAQETPSFYQTMQEEHSQGLLVTFQVQHPGEVLRWLMTWGSHVRVLEPQSVRDMMIREANAILKNHAE